MDAATARCSLQLQDLLQGRVGEWSKGCPGSRNAADERSDNARSWYENTDWWRQPAARIEAVEAVEASEKLFLSALLVAR